MTASPNCKICDPTIFPYFNIKAVIEKPFDIDYFINTISLVLSKHQTQNIPEISKIAIMALRNNLSIIIVWELVKC